MTHKKLVIVMASDVVWEQRIEKIFIFCLYSSTFKILYYLHLYYYFYKYIHR